MHLFDGNRVRLILSTLDTVYGTLDAWDDNFLHITSDDGTPYAVGVAFIVLMSNADPEDES